jgi:hypothetical protein
MQVNRKQKLKCLISPPKTLPNCALERAPE